MNISSFGCGSGCESGWTSYLEQSYLPADHQWRRNGEMVDYEHGYGRRGGKEESHYEEEDLSMVSDASSGPQHFREYQLFSGENGSFAPPTESEKKRGKKKKNRKKETEQKNSSLDDTASSSLVGFSQGESAFQRHFAFLNSSAKPASDEQGGFRGRNW